MGQPSVIYWRLCWLGCRCRCERAHPCRPYTPQFALMCVALARVCLFAGSADITAGRVLLREVVFTHTL